MELAENISILAGTRNQNAINLFYAEVTSVNEVERTCVINSTSFSATDIEFTVDLCILGNTGLVIIPTVGSQVMVIFNKGVNPSIIQHSYIDKILLNGDTNGGIPISSDLVSRLNTVENKINSIISSYNLHTHTETSTVTTVPIIPITGTLTPTQESDIASTTIFQG